MSDLISGDVISVTARHKCLSENLLVKVVLTDRPTDREAGSVRD